MSLCDQVLGAGSRAVVRAVRVAGGVQGAGSRGACSRAGEGRRVLIACWARAERRGAAETDLHRFESRGLLEVRHVAYEVFIGITTKE